MDSCTGSRDSMDTVESMKMSYELLRSITDNFSEKQLLGSGTFGKVYKGADANGKEIAVKVLRDMAAIDDMNFKNEFQNLAKLDHQNIVQLVGYCNESEDHVVQHDGRQVTAEKLHMALCFEYVDNGSLNKYITDENQGLQWHIRYKIIKGICEGLKHLHNGMEKPVLHLDLKPDNILLDKEMIPKIADFGLSRLIGDERTRKTMNKSIGTPGYLPPEYTKYQLLSTAFDIYSLGIIIKKIMVGKERYHEIADMRPGKLILLVHNNWKKKLEEIVARPISLERYCQQVKACIKVASKCMTEDRHGRPKIQEIVDILNETEMIDIPSAIEEFQESWTRITSVQTSERGVEASRSSHPEKRPNCPTVTLRKLPFNLLKHITDDFSEARILGEGIFGVTYKGVYEDGHVIAVKILKSMAAVDGTEFQRELECLSKVQHENIVQLLGFCDEEEDFVVQHNGRNVIALKIHRALCFKYMENGSLRRYISDETEGLDWCTRYRIMKGTCNGLRYLHEELPSPTYHLDLKPDNILLDENMVPKIGDFALSRLLGEERTRKTISAVGTMGYMAPEYLNYQIISNKFDIYSLGVILLEVMAGRQERILTTELPPRQFIEHVLKKWRKRLEATMKGRSLEAYCQQVKRCIEISLRCVEADRRRRPTIGEVVHMLEESEALIHDYSELIHVHPRELRFPFKPKKHVSCLLQLHNKQDDDHVAFRLASDQSPAKYLSKLPLWGVVPPGCTYTLALTTCKQPQRQTSDSDEGCFLLQSVTVNHRSYHDQAWVIRECESLFNMKAQETSKDEVQEVMLKSFCAPQAEEAASKMTRPEIEIIATLDAKQVSSIQVHPEKPWIMTTHQGGNLRVWDYHKMAILNPIDVPDQPVYVAKFIAREDWVVAGDGIGQIHVFSYDENKEATSFEAHNGQIMSLAVHPTDPYVLSSSHDDHLIKLWHWDKYWDFESGGWTCTRKFEGYSDKVSQIVFNPEDIGSFASASWDGTVKILGINSDECTTLDKHSDTLLCVDYVTGADRLHLITGSKDRTAQIWDLETKRCREYLQGHADHISVVYCHPELQKLITGSVDGTVRIWDSTNYRLENIIAFNLGAVYGFGYIEELQRIIVGCHQGIATMEINSMRAQSQA